MDIPRDRSNTNDRRGSGSRRRDRVYIPVPAPTNFHNLPELWPRYFNHFTLDIVMWAQHYSTTYPGIIYPGLYFAFDYTRATADFAFLRGIAFNYMP